MSNKYKFYFDEDDIAELDLSELLDIGPDLSSEFSKQASLYAYVGTLSAKMEALWIQEKRFLEETYAKIDGKARRDLMDLPKVTEAMVKAGILLEPEYKNALDIELDAKEQHLILQVITKAMEMKANMLVSLGAHLREESKQTGMSINNVKNDINELKSKRGRR